MMRCAGTVLAALALAAAGCATDTSTPAAAPSTTGSAPASSTPFPEPPAYTHEVDGKVIRVFTPSSDPTDLEATFNHLARTLRGSLPEGGYHVQIDCATSGTGNVRARLASGRLGVGRLGVAQIGGFGGFDGVTGATCP